MTVKDVCRSCQLARDRMLCGGNASTGDNICGKVVGIVCRARGPVGESGNDSFDREDAIKPKKQDRIAVALKRVTTMAEGAMKDDSNVMRGVTAMVAAKKGGGNGPIRAAVVAQ